MQTRIFIDTVFVVALINRRDQYHALAASLAEELEGHPLLVSDAVLLEIGNALARGYRRQAVAVIEKFLSAEEVVMVRLTPELFDRALALYRASEDQEWSLIDCISFTVMREAGVSRVLTFDRHFEQAGFVVVKPGGGPA